jgi:hypothetical protein
MVDPEKRRIGHGGQGEGAVLKTGTATRLVGAATATPSTGDCTVRGY